MQIYKFPFDTQNCTLSLKSIIYPEDVEEATRILFSALRPRGYSRRFLRSIKEEVSRTFIDRYKDISARPSGPTLVPLITTYSGSLSNLLGKLKANFEGARGDCDALRPYQLISAYRRNKNLQDLLVHTNLNKTTKTREAPRVTEICVQTGENMKTVILALMVLVLVVVSQGGSTNNNTKDDNNNGLNGQLSIKKGPCDRDSEKSKFPYEDVLNCLDLTNNKEMLVRPAGDYKKPTWIYVQMSILAILDVKEIDQTFVSFVWIYMKWEDRHIYWNPRNFGGLDKMTVPTDLLWKPDLMIEEMIEKDKAVPNPFITIHSNGFVEHVMDLMVVSTCKMQIYKFPFDTQNCTLSLKSIIYPEEELKFEFFENNTLVTEWTRQMLRNESEWFLIGMTVQHQSVLRFHQNQSVVIYTITMKRRSLLYVVNFLVPVLLLFVLDLASFVISDSEGEKLGFEVTLLLAVTVMQLILNDILPCSSDSIPLIVVYCIGIFGLMMVSLLETILVMYLIEKDSASKEKKADKNRSLSEDCGDKQGNYDGDVKKWTHCACVCNVSDEPPSDLLSVAKEDKRSQLMEESNSLEKLPDELSEAVKGLSLLLSRKEERKPDYWTRVAKKLDIIFFFVYFTVSALFLVVLFSLWINAEDE
ncbi:hypothetical protein NQZ68_018755 [Dissostichus eleginoides]|nr:hypothetical protein NQZ68_018755 [Dissostichus eleginoides]